MMNKYNKKMRWNKLNKFNRIIDNKMLGNIMGFVIYLYR